MPNGLAGLITQGLLFFMQATGWIKLHRQICDAPWASKPEYVALWVYLLIAANHKPNNWLYKNKPYMISRGQFITSRKTLSEKTGIAESTITYILNCFESERQIARKNLYTSTCITILNYDLYQSNNDNVDGKLTANERQTDGQLSASKQQANTIEECINVNNVETVKNENNNTNTAPVACSLKDKKETSKPVREKKTSEKMIPPTVEEFIDYAKIRYQGNFSEIENSVKYKFQAWIENNWCDGNGKPILNWKTTFLNSIQFFKKEGAVNKSSDVRPVASLFVNNPKVSDFEAADKAAAEKRRVRAEKLAAINQAKTETDGNQTIN